MITSQLLISYLWLLTAKYSYKYGKLITSWQSTKQEFAKEPLYIDDVAIYNHYSHKKSPQKTNKLESTIWLHHS